MAQFVEISADRRTYMLNGVEFLIDYPLSMALQDIQQIGFAGDEHFEFAFRGEQEQVDVARNLSYEFNLETKNDDDLDGLFISEDEDEEEEESQDQKDKDNLDQRFAKIEKALHEGRITMRERMYNTQYMCCNN